MFDRKKFSVRLHDLRISNNINQQTLANILDVSVPQISDMERARRTTTIEKLYTLAEYFDVSIDYLVGRSDNPKMNVCADAVLATSIPAQPDPIDKVRI